MKYNFWMGICALGLFMGSCSGHGHEGHNHEEHEAALHQEEGHEGHNHEEHEAVLHQEESPEGHSGEIVLTAEKAKAAGVEVMKIEPGTFRQVIPASGQLLSAQGDEVTVVASVSGVVSFARTLTEGSQVAEHATLLTVSADNLQDGDPVKRARIAYETAKAEYERAAKLVDKQIVSQKDFNQLRENYENARIAYEALSPGKNGRGVAVVSPVGGYVKACLVKEGDYVTVGQSLLSVTRSHRLQLRADVSERFYPNLRSVVSANFRTNYGDRTYRLEDLNGRLLSYGRTSGNSSLYIPVTFELDNRGDLLPGAFAEIFLLGEERNGVISLPVSALTEEQGTYFVYQKLDADCYQKVEVRIGASNGDRVEVLSGLKGGEEIVVQGAIHVKLASAANAIPGHTHNH